MIDPHILHTLESVVIEWSHQVRDVLKRDSSESLLQGLNPLPTTELTFWSDRHENLQCIYDQVIKLSFVAFFCILIYIDPQCGKDFIALKHRVFTQDSTGLVKCLITNSPQFSDSFLRTI